MSGRAAGGLLNKLKPWMNQGPVSTAEFLDSVPAALAYRRISPASQADAIVPHAENDKIFDIKYFNRDTKRNYSEVTEVVDVTATALELPESGVRGMEFAGWKPTRVPLMDVDNDGYTTR